MPSRVLWLLCLLLACVHAQAKTVPHEVVVADPYIEMHTGPGKGYPVFFVVGRGDKITLLKQRTDWYLVREHQGREGWVKEAALLSTLELDGQPVRIDVPNLQSLAKHRYEGAMLLGDFGGASLITLSGSYGFTDHLSVGLTLGHAMGNIYNSQLVSLDLTHTLFPEWRVSPYISLGVGVVQTSPHTTQARTVDSTDQFSFVGAGVRLYLTRRFIARAEYHSNYIYTSRNANEDPSEWKAGFAFFF